MQPHFQAESARATFVGAAARSALRADCPEWTRHPPAPALALGHADQRILIVNEDMRSADALKRTLAELGYRATFTAYSARRALVAADDFSPAIALLDLELPDMSGFQLAQKLRAHASRHVRRVSLIAVAESDAFGNGELASAAGFAGCLTKPVRPTDLNRLLHSLWRC